MSNRYLKLWAVRANPDGLLCEGRGITRFAYSMMNSQPPPKPDIKTATPQITRRKWLRRMAWGTGALAAGVVIDTFFIEPHWLEIVERDLPIRNLPSHWDGKRLVQISDI